jgi:hypothetical protein
VDLPNGRNNEGAPAQPVHKVVEKAMTQSKENVQLRRLTQHKSTS